MLSHEVRKSLFSGVVSHAVLFIMKEQIRINEKSL